MEPFKVEFMNLLNQGQTKITLKRISWIHLEMALLKLWIIKVLWDRIAINHNRPPPTPQPNKIKTNQIKWANKDHRVLRRRDRIVQIKIINKANKWIELNILGTLIVMWLDLMLSDKAKW